MRTNVKSGALSSVDPVEMKAVDGGITLAFDSRAGSVLSKYVDEISKRFGPTIDGPIDLDQQRQYP